MVNPIRIIYKAVAWPINKAYNTADALLHPVRTVKDKFGSSHTDKYSSEKREEKFNEYRNQLNVNPSGVFTVKAKSAFEDFANNRPAGITVFEKTKGPKDDLYPKLNAAGSAEAAAIRAELEDALKKEDEFKEARKRYSLSIMTFEKLCERIPESYTAEALAATMIKLIDDARQAIKAQHKEELKRLGALFEQKDDPAAPGTKIDSPFVKNLKVLDPTLTDKDIELVKKNMIDDLTSSQKSQLQEFDKETSEAKNNLFGAMQKQSREMAFLVLMAKRDKSGTLRRTLEQIAQEKRKNSTAPAMISVTSKIKKGEMDISGVTLDDIEQIVSITGSVITREKTVNKNGQSMGVYTVQIPRIITHPMRYGSPIKKTVALMMNVAQAVKAEGFNSIVMDVDFENPTVQAKRNKQAFEACILAGFAPDKIVINNGGVAVKAEDIYKDNPSELAALKQTSLRMQADANKPLIDDYKAELSEITAVEAVMSTEAALVAKDNPTLGHD